MFNKLIRCVCSLSLPSSAAITVCRYSVMSAGKLKSEHFSKVVTPELLGLENMFKSRGYDFRLVGGVVRDLLMDKLPNDVDISTDCVPDEMVKIFAAENVRYIPTGLLHGTVTVVMNGTNYEITTLRSDVSTDGRRATVEFVKDWKMDAARRDLTINAMSLSLDGQLYDYFSGEQHLASRRILFVGSPQARIEEDYLRILRYFRFYGRLVPTADAHDTETLEAIQDLGEGLRMISAERIWMEMQKIVLGNHAPSLVALMRDLGVALHIGMPHCLDVEEMKRVWSCTRSQTVEAGSPIHSMQPVSMVAGVVLSPAEFLSLAERWKLSNKEKNLGSFLVEHREEARKESTLVKYYQDLLVRQVERSFVEELARYCDRMDCYLAVRDWTVPVMPLSGRDLMAAGVAKGAMVGIIKERMKSRWMESHYKLGREELLEMVVKEVEKDAEHMNSDRAAKKQRII